jgi:hypothetical protein
MSRARADLQALPEAGAPDVLYLLDLSNWARAAYEGARHKGVDVDDPESVLVVQAVVSRLVDDVLVKRRPAYMAVCADVLGERSWRAALWDGYKAGRWQTEKGKLAEQIRDGAEAARLSRHLVAFALDAPISCSLQDLAMGWGEIDARAIDALGVKHGLPKLRTACALPKLEVDGATEERWLAAGAIVEAEGAKRHGAEAVVGGEHRALGDCREPRGRGDAPTSGHGDAPRGVRLSADVAGVDEAPHDVRGRGGFVRDHAEPRGLDHAEGTRLAGDGEAVDDIERAALIEEAGLDAEPGRFPVFAYVLRSEYDLAAETAGAVHRPRSVIRVLWDGDEEDVEIPNCLVKRYVGTGEPVPDPSLPILPPAKARVVGAPPTQAPASQEVAEQMPTSTVDQAAPAPAPATEGAVAKGEPVEESKAEARGDTTQLSLFGALS